MIYYDTTTVDVYSTVQYLHFVVMSVEEEDINFLFRRRVRFYIVVGNASKGSVMPIHPASAKKTRVRFEHAMEEGDRDENIVCVTRVLFPTAFFYG